MSQFNTGLSAPLSSLGKEFHPANGILMYTDCTGSCDPFFLVTGVTATPNSSSFTFTSTMGDKAFGECVMTLAGVQGARVGMFAGTAANGIGNYANGVYGISTVNASVLDRSFRFVDMPYDFEARVSITSFPTALQKVCVGFGSTHAGANPTFFLTDGAAFTSVNGGNWQCSVAAGNVVTNTATSYPSNTYQRLRIRTNPTSNTIQFIINDVLVHSTSPTWDVANSFLAWGAEAREKGVTGALQAGTWKIDYMRLAGTIAR